MKDIWRDFVHPWFKDEDQLVHGDAFWIKKAGCSIVYTGLINQYKYRDTLKNDFISSVDLLYGKTPLGNSCKTGLLPMQHTLLKTGSLKEISRFSLGVPGHQISTRLRKFGAGWTNAIQKRNPTSIEGLKIAVQTLVRSPKRNETDRVNAKTR